MTLDFKTNSRGGTSVRVYDQDGVQISLGDWTVVVIDGLRFEFDRHEFEWTASKLADPTGPGAGTLVHEVLLVACKRSTPLTFRRMMQMLNEAYVMGVRHGEQHRSEQFRMLLGL